MSRAGTSPRSHMRSAVLRCTPMARASSPVVMSVVSGVSSRMAKVPSGPMEAHGFRPFLCPTREATCFHSGREPSAQRERIRELFSHQHQSNRLAGRPTCLSAKVVDLLLVSVSFCPLYVVVQAGAGVSTLTRVNQCFNGLLPTMLETNLVATIKISATANVSQQQINGPREKNSFNHAALAIARSLPTMRSRASAKRPSPSPSRPSDCFRSCP